MATLADSLISSTSRSVQLRMRPDLTSRRHRYHGRSFWVVKEPVGLNYFRFHEEEFAILCMLDGQASLEDVKEQFEAEFAPQKITFQDLQHFIGMLHRSGLVVSEAMGQGRQLKKRRDEKKWREFLGKIANVFALRFKGVDPERLLNWLYPYVGWLFHPFTMILAVTLGLSALSLVAVEFDVFRSRLPTFHQFFGPHNWIYLGATMAAVKVLHEFGHGFSCKHYGGECHELGAMLLVFTPCLYCNVSDSWMLPNKWQRAFIGAAGMYVEMILASLATFLWWFSEPGLLNQLALSVMFICSVSTLLFNGNPLLRFDGYYILMDLAEIPNLRQKSTEVLKRFMVQTCLGIEQPDNPFLPQQRRMLFALYTLAAVVYRWVVTFSILYFLNKVLEPYGLKIIGQLIAVAGLFGLVVQPLWQLAKFFYLPGRMHKMKMPRVAASLAVAVALIVAFCYLPLPFHVDCTFEVSPRDGKPVYPAVPGRLVELAVQPGDRVEPGQPLAKLENIDVQMEVERLTGERNRLERQLESLKRQLHENPEAGLQIPAVDEMLAMVRQELREQSEQLLRLTITAPVAGVVFPPPYRSPKKSPDGRLPMWTGSPFEPHNADAFLQTQDPLCQLGHAEEFEAVLVVDQTDVDLVARYFARHREFPAVDMKLDAYRWAMQQGQITKVASAPMTLTPMSLASQGGGELNTKMDESGQLRPISTSYQARVPLANGDGALRLGLTGRAKIYTGWQSLGERTYRYIIRTFRFDW